MNKLKAVIIIETAVIIIMIGFFVIDYLNLSLGYKNVHCRYHDNGLCLLSPRIYADLIPPKSYLILNFDPIQNDLQSYIDKNHFNSSVYVVNLRDGASFGINEEKSYPAASLNKLPIAILILKKVEKGELSLETKLPILDSDRDSQSGTLYAEPVNELSVKELLHYMLSESDNTATLVLQKDLTKDDLENLTEYIDYYSINISSQKLPLKITEITPKSVSNIFSSIYLSTILDSENSELILYYLTNTSFDIKKYAQLPPDVVVSQKYGFHYLDDGSFFHDCGIIYIEDSKFSYCIMTKDIDREKASEVIGTIVNKLYNFVVENKNKK